MDFEIAESELAVTIENAMSATALFEQYDELVDAKSANDDAYENLYPNFV